MKWDRIEGNWMQFKGHVKAQWGRLTDDQLETIAGKREVLAGRIREVYGLTAEVAEHQITWWQEQLKETEPLKEIQ
jgi:uncharacterized protein YjbJ (UPF0337 family)